MPNSSFRPITPRMGSLEYVPSFINVRCLVSISVQPESVSVNDGEPGSFSVTAQNFADTGLDYQWQVSTDGETWTNLTNDSTYSGVTTDTLEVDPVSLALDGNSYRAVVSSSSCSVNSNPAVLSITELDMVCESESGTYTLCGFSEWQPSSPPKKFLTLTSSGGVKQCSFLGSTSCGSANPTVAFFPRVGVLTYDPAGCTVNTVNQTELRDVLANCSLTPTTPATSYALAQRTTAPATGVTKVFDSDSYSEVHDEVCQTVGPNSIRNSGTVLQDLTDEDTETAAIARAAKTPGTSCTAYRELRGAGDFTGAFADVTFTINVGGLTAGLDYQIRVTITEEDYGGGSPVVTYRTYDFTASGPTHSEVDTLVPAAGKQLTASSPVLLT